MKSALDVQEASTGSRAKDLALQLRCCFIGMLTTDEFTVPTRSWDPGEGHSHCQCVLQVCMLSKIPPPTPPSLSASQLPGGGGGCKQLSFLDSSTVMYCLTTGPETTEPRKHELIPKTRKQNKPFLLKMLCLRHLVTLTKSGSVHTIFSSSPQLISMEICWPSA